MIAASSMYSQFTDLPRIAELEVAAVNIFEPFSNSISPLFQTATPCCIQLGRYSYISWYLDKTSLAAVALFAIIAAVLLSLNNVKCNIHAALTTVLPCCLPSIRIVWRFFIMCFTFLFWQGYNLKSTTPSSSDTILQ